jgi:hypothetical protein
MQIARQESSIPSYTGAEFRIQNSGVRSQEHTAGKRVKIVKKIVLGIFNGVRSEGDRGVSKPPGSVLF